MLVRAGVSLHNDDYAAQSGSGIVVGEVREGTVVIATLVRPGPLRDGRAWSACGRGTPVKRGGSAAGGAPRFPLASPAPPSGMSLPRASFLAPPARFPLAGVLPPRRRGNPL